MKVRVNHTPPVVSPPDTVDIIGLSREDAEKLTALLGRLLSGEIRHLYLALWEKLYGGLPHENPWLVQDAVTEKPVIHALKIVKRDGPPWDLYRV